MEQWTKQILGPDVVHELGFPARLWPCVDRRMWDRVVTPLTTYAESIPQDLVLHFASHYLSMARSRIPNDHLPVRNQSSRSRSTCAFTGVRKSLPVLVRHNQFSVFDFTLMSRRIGPYQAWSFKRRSFLISKIYRFSANLGFVDRCCSRADRPSRQKFLRNFPNASGHAFPLDVALDGSVCPRHCACCSVRKKKHAASDGRFLGGRHGPNQKRSTSVILAS